MRGCSKTLHPFHRAGAACIGFAVFAVVCGDASAAEPGRTAQASPLLSTLAQVAARVASELGPSVKEPAVFVGPVRSDETVVRAAELASRIGGLVTGALGPGSSTRSEPVALSTAQALTRKAARGQLQVTADAYRATHNVWDRVRQPSPVPVAHGFATGRIDGEVRSYLAPVPLVASRVDRAAIDERDLVAVACGDTGDGGGLELVTLSRRRVAAGRVRAGRFVARRSIALRDLSGVAPAPLREPIGGLVIVTPRGARAGFIDVGISDRARGARLDVDLGRVGTIAGIPISTPGGDACATFQGSTLNAIVAKCTDADAPLDPIPIGTPLDAGASAAYALPDGTVRVIAAKRDPRTAELTLTSDGKTASLPGAGAQVAVADLDQDGAPEIISTLDVLPDSTATGDAIVIQTWQADGSLRERTRLVVPTGVRAVAACPPEGSGAATVVVATEGELWILR